jgi:hypothetical protein
MYHELIEFSLQIDQKAQIISFIVPHLEDKLEEMKTRIIQKYDSQNTLMEVTLDKFSQYSEETHKRMLTNKEEMNANMHTHYISVALVNNKLCPGIEVIIEKQDYVIQATRELILCRAEQKKFEKL